MVPSGFNKLTIRMGGGGFKHTVCALRVLVKWWDVSFVKRVRVCIKREGRLERRKCVGTALRKQVHPPVKIHTVPRSTL